MKILVLQLKRIGDLILTTPALRALREKLPAAKITLLSEATGRELLPAIGDVNEHLVFSRHGENRALWRRLGLASFDLCLDFTGTDRSAFFSLLSKATTRVAFSSVRNSMLRSLCYNRFVDSPVLESHTIDHYLHLLRAIDSHATGRDIVLNLPEWTFKKSRQLLEANGVGERFAVIAPAAARPEKYWLAERWADVIRYCQEQLGLPVVLIASSDKVEREQVEKIKRLAPCIDLAGRLDLLSLTALARQSTLFLSLDSAPMHLAASQKVAQIALFGPTNPFHWRPLHPRAVAVTASDCAIVPNRRGERRSMSDLSTQQVIDAMTSLSADVPKA